jgi:hypothetical protein
MSLLALAGCGPPRLPSVQLFVEDRVHAAAVAPTGQALRQRATRNLTAGVRVGFELDGQGRP